MYSNICIAPYINPTPDPTLRKACGKEGPRVARRAAGAQGPDVKLWSKVYQVDVRGSDHLMATNDRYPSLYRLVIDVFEQT